MPPRYNRQLNTILATVKERCHMDQLGFLGSRCRTRKSLCNPGRRRGLWHECQFRSKGWCCFSSLGQVNFKYHKSFTSQGVESPWDHLGARSGVECAPGEYTIQSRMGWTDLIPGSAGFD